jgi:hypothetical protein
MRSIYAQDQLRGIGTWQLYSEYLRKGILPVWWGSQLGGARCTSPCREKASTPFPSCHDAPGFRGETGGNLHLVAHADLRRRGLPFGAAPVQLGPVPVGAPFHLLDVQSLHVLPDPGGTRGEVLHPGRPPPGPARSSALPGHRSLEMGGLALGDLGMDVLHHTRAVGVFRALGILSPVAGGVVDASKTAESPGGAGSWFLDRHRARDRIGRSGPPPGDGVR